MTLPLVAMIAPAKPASLDDFLGQLLPAEGDYLMLMRRCKKGMAHETFSSVDEMAQRIRELDGAGVEVWHAVASFANRHDDANAAGNGKWGRKNENVSHLGAFFLDIDVDVEKDGKGYGTLDQAADAVAHFAERLGQPYNYLVASGSGLHVYWLLDKDVPRKRWQQTALKLKDATKLAGLLADPVRTADATSVLRPIGTVNRKAKYGSAGRLVDGQWCRYGRVNYEEFEAACDRVIGECTQGGKTVLLGGECSSAHTEPAQWFSTLSDEVKWYVLRSLLSALPPEYVRDYAQWLAVGAALAGIGQLQRDGLFNLWAEWSQSTPEGAASWQQGSVDEQRRRWEGLTRSGVGALIQRARGAGWNPRALSVDSDDKSSHIALLSAFETHVQRWTVREAETYLRERLMFVRGDNQYLLDGLPLSKEALDTSLAPQMPFSERPVTASGLFKKGAGTVIDYLGYKPGAGRVFVDRDGRKIANLWRDSAIEPVKPSIEDARTFAEFVIHLYCGNAETRAGIKRIFTKFAFLFLHPSARIRHATLLIGKNEGCGKSTVTLAIPRALFGNANVRSVETRELSSDFNGYAQDSRILVFPEMWLGSRRDALTQANNLKPLITDDTIPIVKKGRDGRVVENFTTIFASSNHADAAVFGARDRRYDVISTDASMMALDLSKRIYSLINDRPSALLWLVLAFGKDAATFNPNAPPVQTLAKKEMMDATKGMWAERIRDAFDAREWPFKGDAVAVSDVRQYLAREFERPPSDNVIRDELLGMVDGAYSVQAQRRQGANTEQKRVIVMRRINSWKDAGPSALYDHYYAAVIKRGGDS